MPRLRRQRNMPSSQSFQHPPFPPPLQAHIGPSRSSHTLDYPHAKTRSSSRGHIRSSRTWTTSSSDAQPPFSLEEEEDRTYFVQEYNRLAQKHGLRTLTMNKVVSAISPSNTVEKRHWFSRMLRSSSRESPLVPEAPRPPPFTRSKRSISDLAYHLVNTRAETPKRISLQSMVRLSGKSILYLPPEFTTQSLVLPTCLRATAQHLVLHAATRGIFRIPGSSRAVDALFDYYCFTGPMDADVASTVRCANLPLHIQSSVHDVASTFKRLLSVVPGGILGSLSTFDALVAVNSQLRGDPEFPRTKQTKLRARLIALIINITSTQLQRSLICAVFGLLSLIGRISENTPREDDQGRPLPTSDLMGYGALGIVFGPLLIGDLLDQYTMKLATPSAGLMLLPLSPQKSRRRHKPTPLPRGIKGAMVPTVNKILVANDIVQMITMNWRDIVRQLRSLENDPVNGIVTMPQSDSLRQPQFRSGSDLQPLSDSNRRQPAHQDGRSASSSGNKPSINRSKNRPTSRRSEESSSLKPAHRQPSVTALSPTLEEDIDAIDPLPEDSLGEITEEEWQQLQEIGVSVPKMISESVTPIQRQQETSLGDQQLSSSNVPPRTSSKRESPSPKPKFLENTPSPPTKHGLTRLDPELPLTQTEQPPKPQKRLAEAPLSPLSQVQNERGPRSSGSQNVHMDIGSTASEADILHQTCSPMQVPPSLIPHAPEPSSSRSRPEGWSLLNKVTQDESMRPSPGSRKSADKSPERLSHNNRSLIGFSALATDSQVNFYKEASKGDQGHHSRPSSLKAKLDLAPPDPKGTPKFTEAPIQHDGVRAMAAKFDTTPVSNMAPGSKRESTQQLQQLQQLQQRMESGSNPKIKSLRSYRSGPLPAVQRPQRGVWANPLKVPSKDSQTDIREQQDPAPQSVAQRAAAIMKAESMVSDTLGGQRESPNIAKQPTNLGQDDGKGEPRPLERQPPSLGIMTPHQEEPPIAQHLNFSRPASVISVTAAEDPLQVSGGIPPTSRPGATSVLHSQIRSLQKQLHVKTEEAVQLRRQLEAQGTAEIGTLSEQLREAKREARMWKDRAEAAERRVQVFKKFTARLKGIREAATAADEHQAQGRVTGSGDNVSGEDTGPETSSSGTGPPEDLQQMLPKDEQIESCGSDSSGVTEDAGIMTARIRKCLHGSRRSREETQESIASTQGREFGADGATDAVASGSIEDVWLVAKGFLEKGAD